MGDTWHLAIDFGTSNTAAAHTAPMSGTVETLPLSHRSNLMPSAVHAHAGELLSGDTAVSKGRRDPARLVPSPKRYIDHDVVQLAGDEVPVVDVVAAVLRSVVERGMGQHAGIRPGTVTLTHPETWSVHSVGQLVAAAQRAGIDAADTRLISEPRAAAIHYAAQRSIPGGGHVAVFDFGGGTLDIAVLRAGEDGNFEVVAAKGDNSLGGRTIDNLLFRWVIEQVGHDDPDLADYLKKAPVSVMHSLEINIREAKEILSDTSSATVTVSTPAGETDLLLTREEFNHIIDGSVQRGCELTRAALGQAGVNSDATPIYMTGGSSRIPHVQNRLGEVGTVMTLDDPKTVVPRGALTATTLKFSLPADAVVARDNRGGAGATGAGAAGPATEGEPQAPSNPFAGAGGSGDGKPEDPASAGDAANPFASGAPADAGSGAPPTVNNTPLHQGQPAETRQFGQPPAADPGPGEFDTPQPAGSGYHPAGKSTYQDFMPASMREGNKNSRQGGSKVPLLIGGGVAAVAVLATAGWFALGGGDDEEGGEQAAPTTSAESSVPETSGAEPTTEVQAAAAGGLPATPTTTRTSSDMFQTVPDMFPGSENFLPAELLVNMEVCATDARNMWRFNVGGVAGDSLLEMHQCNGSDAAREYSESLGASGTFYTSTQMQQGQDATQIYELALHEDQNIHEVQPASGSAPHIFRSGDSDFGGAVLVYYPEEEFLVQGNLGADAENEDVEQWAVDYGFRA